MICCWAVRVWKGEGWRTLVSVCPELSWLPPTLPASLEEVITWYVTWHQVTHLAPSWPPLSSWCWLWYSSASLPWHSVCSETSQEQVSPPCLLVAVAISYQVKLSPWLLVAMGMSSFEVFLTVFLPQHITVLQKMLQHLTVTIGLKFVQRLWG